MKFYTSVGKRLKLKVRKFWQLIPTFEEVTGEKLVGREGGGGLILNRVSILFNTDINISSPRNIVISSLKEEEKFAEEMRKFPSLYGKGNKQHKEKHKKNSMA